MHNPQKFVNWISFFALVAATPLIVYAALQKSDIRQQAAATPACTVDFSFPVEQVYEGLTVRITILKKTPPESSDIWKYASLYEVDPTGTIIGSYGMCLTDTCIIHGKENGTIKNKAGTHKLLYAVHDTTVYGKDIQLSGQTTDKVSCATSGNDSFVTLSIPKALSQ